MTHLSKLKIEQHKLSYEDIQITIKFIKTLEILGVNGFDDFMYAMYNSARSLRTM